MKLQKREWKMHQQLQKREEDNPILDITKTTSHPWENEANNQKHGMKTHRKNFSHSQKPQREGEW